MLRGRHVSCVLETAGAGSRHWLLHIDHDHILCRAHCTTTSTTIFCRFRLLSFSRNLSKILRCNHGIPFISQQEQFWYAKLPH